MNWKWDRWESSGDLLEIFWRCSGDVLEMFWRCSGEGRRGAEGTQRGMGAQKGSREGESSGDVLEMFWLQKDRRRIAEGSQKGSVEWIGNGIDDRV